MINYEKGYWLNEESRTFLSRGYLEEGQTAESRIRKMGDVAERILGIEGFADKFEDYMLRGWFSISSPIWSNFGNERGLPISCNGSYVADNISSIISKVAEVGMMTKYGAGTSAYVGALRASGSPISVGGVSKGPVHFLELFEGMTDVVSQSNIRRGSCAVYLDVEHKDIKEFLKCRDEMHPIQNLSLGVCISDKWMSDMISGDGDKREVWASILRKRFETGYPYIFWTDTVNRGKPDVYKDLGKIIYASNLCSEIALPSSEDESFVCNLSSMNLLHYKDWSGTDAVFILTAFLNAVMIEYIEKTKGLPFMEAAHNFAKNHRAIGIGVLGWHSFLQRYMIAFESEGASNLNKEFMKEVHESALEASKLLTKYIEPSEMMKPYGRVNSTVTSIAPTTSSSFILGQVSPSIEPLKDNYFIKNVAKGKFSYKNPFLKEVLIKYGMDTEDVWKSILMDGGSVRNLTFLSEHERDVFKTFGEISQMSIINQAADRQEYLDQSQSINLVIHPDTPLKEVNTLMITAWSSGVKTLYYQRGTNPAQEMVRNLISCASCEA